MQNYHMAVSVFTPNTQIRLAVGIIWFHLLEPIFRFYIL